MLRIRLLRRLSDLLSETDFLLVQLITLHSTTGPHRMRDQQMRMAALHGRLDQLEYSLRQRAAELGEDPEGSLGHIRRRLATVPDRRRSGDGYEGLDRRRCERRAQG